MSAVLEQVCEALGRAGVPAAPYQGLGVRWGHELLEAKVVIRDVRTLYERMAQAEPGRARVRVGRSVDPGPAQRRAAASSAQ